MPITAKASSGGGNPVSEGVHVALCTRVIDMGTQFSQTFGNSNHKIMIAWEIPDDTVQIDGEEKPKMISKEYTLSLGEKARLRADLESWRGKKFTDTELNGFDLVNILGKACQVQILHNEKGYANISSIMSTPKGMPAPNAVTEMIYFDLTDEKSLSLMDKIPEWIRDKIKESPEYASLTRGQSGAANEFVEVDIGEDEVF